MNKEEEETTKEEDLTLSKKIRYDKEEVKAETVAKVAIIVPFRDSDPKQARHAHLMKLIPYMNEYLKDIVKDFHLYIIEQSDDKRKFNRGKLLNLGFLLAKEDGYNTFIFHDVDLLPNKGLSKYYSEIPPTGTIYHIAKCWSRYNQNDKYLGGIVSFNLEDFEKINGFPNTYWGWGGEDDELSKRVHFAKISVEGPDKNSKDCSILDLEEMSLQEKLIWLRANSEIKCGVKWEVNDEHDKYRGKLTKPAWWGVDGLKLNVFNRNDTSHPNCSIVTVDVGYNYEKDGSEHWTNTKMKFS